MVWDLDTLHKLNETAENKHREDTFDRAVIIVDTILNAGILQEEVDRLELVRIVQRALVS